MPQTMTTEQYQAALQNTPADAPKKRKRRKGKTPEQTVKDACKLVLDAHGIFSWPVATTGIWDPVRGAFRKNRGQVGVADRCGVLPDGRALALEVKKPGKKPTPDQLEFLAKVNGKGGLGLWCDNAQALDRMLTKEGY